MASTSAVPHRLRAALQERRRHSRADRALRHDLATFSTPADVDDLLATLDRAEGPQVEEMRSILNRQVRIRQHNRSPVPFAF